MHVSPVADLLFWAARLGTALALGFPVGWERERRQFSPGLRTFPLVSMGSCAFLLIGQHAFASHPDAQARVFQALLSGIGFIGGGAIVKGRFEVHGLSTAVGIWMTAAVGVAVAYSMFLLAVALSLTTVVTLHILTPKRPPPEPDKDKFEQ